MELSVGNVAELLLQLKEYNERVKLEEERTGDKDSLGWIGKSLEELYQTSVDIDHWDFEIPEGQDYLVCQKLLRSGAMMDTLLMRQYDVRSILTSAGMFIEVPCILSNRIIQDDEYPYGYKTSSTLVTVIRANELYLYPIVDNRVFPHMIRTYKQYKVLLPDY